METESIATFVDQYVDESFQFESYTYQQLIQGITDYMDALYRSKNSEEFKLILHNFAVLFTYGIINEYFEINTDRKVQFLAVVTRMNQDDYMTTRANNDKSRSYDSMKLWESFNSTFVIFK